MTLSGRAAPVPGPHSQNPSLPDPPLLPGGDHVAGEGGPSRVGGAGTGGTALSGCDVHMHTPGGASGSARSKRQNVSFGPRPCLASDRLDVGRDGTRARVAQASSTSGATVAEPRWSGVMKASRNAEYGLGLGLSRSAFEHGCVRCASRRATAPVGSERPRTRLRFGNGLSRSLAGPVDGGHRDRFGDAFELDASVLARLHVILQGSEGCSACQDFPSRG